MPMMADDSDSSGLSEHSDKEIQKLAPVFLKAKKASKLVAPPPVVSPPKPKRPPSPPHEEVLADNGDIAFIVMFRSRFSDAFSSKLPNLGPQDIENGVVDSLPSTQVDQLLRALLALVLNRKKPVEQGHYGRALEEAVLSQKDQWPHKWNGVNPLHGGKNFENMSPAERLDLLRTLILWSLSKSEVIQSMIKDKYKQQRQNSDENQPLSVQPWGIDGDKRHHYLVQGLDDTSFRIYREGRRDKKNMPWWSVAGSIDEAKELAKKLEETDGTQFARRFAGRIHAAIPVFEATEEKRRRREYRQVRRAAFTRPEPGFSMYEGRTRGKRMRYTYDDDDAFLSDDTSTRRSARQSARNTPFESGLTVTASGRQVRQPRTGEYGESLLSNPPTNADQVEQEYSEAEGVVSRARSGTEDSEEPVRSGRATRTTARPVVNGASNPRKRKHIDTYNSIDEMSDEDDADASSGGWNTDQNDGEDEQMPDAEDQDNDMSEGDEGSEDEDEEEQSLVVRLKVPSGRLSHIGSGRASAVGVEKTNDDSTSAGAPKCESSEPSVVKSEAPQQQSLGSSPQEPLAYPTPTSSSFLPVEQKPTLAPLSTFQATSPASSEYKTGNTGFANGSIESTIPKTENNPFEGKAKLEGVSAPRANGVMEEQCSSSPAL